jgi:predicted nucleic acid-binding protein
MSRYFLDSSALAKRYRSEAGTDTVDRIVEHPDSACLVSRLALTELCSLFALRIRVGDITQREFDIVRDLVRSDLRSGRLTMLPVWPSHFDKADELLVTEGFQRGLRALDAIQVAIAMEASTPTPATFVAADKKLLTVVPSCGLAILHPENP